MVPVGVRFSSAFLATGLPAEALESIIGAIDVERILPARVWLARAEHGVLDMDDVCLTFDGEQRAQYDYVRPVLKRHGLTAFWFVSAPFLQDRPTDARRGPWIGDEEVCDLRANGHVIGIRSQSCPAWLGERPVREQIREYRDNVAYLLELLGERPRAMAHADHSYSPETLQILRQMGVKLGFRVDATLAEFSELEYPRVCAAMFLPKTQSKSPRVAVV